MADGGELSCRICLANDGKIEPIELRQHMGKRLAILIAVENYHDTRVPPVQFAEADATGFSAALQLGGLIDEVLLLSTGATRTSINSKVRQHVKTLTADDELFLFYAGHGFSKNGHNFITCYDTDRDDLENTSILLKDLLDACGNSACNRIAMFLDSCESGITDIPEIRGIYSTMSDKELGEFFKDTQYRVCFASCKTSESSYSAPLLKHGVWTHNVIQALEGADSLALEKGRYVTAMSLQNYLKKEIPRTLRAVFSSPVTQTPWFYGSQSSDFVVSDLLTVLQQRNAVKPGYEQVKQVFLRIQESMRVASLSGFSKQKGHRVPDNVNGATERFVESISNKEITDEIEKVHKRIREGMKYKRRDIMATAGRIVTPDFEYLVEVTQDREDPGKVMISRQLINISPSIIGDDAFNDVFKDYFDDLTFEFTMSVDLKDVIDRVEDLELGGIDLDYPADCSYLDITIGGPSPKVRVTPHALTVHGPNKTSPKLLMESFFAVQQKLIGTPVLKAITQSSAA